MVLLRALRRRRCVALLSVLTVSVLACGCDLRDQQAAAPARPPAPIAPTARSLAPAEAGLLAGDAPEVVLERLDAPFRLEPDQRFLAALSRVPAFVGQASPIEVSATFESGRWQLRATEEKLGDVVDLPGFAELYAVLLARAERALGGAAVPAPSAAQPFAPESVHPREWLAVVREADAQPKGQLSAALARRAAHALTQEAVRDPDEMGMADVTVAQALAAVAFAEALGQSPMPRERTVLARCMGYVTGARALSSSLPEGDATRAYAGDDLKALISAATQQNAAPLAVLLAMRAAWMDGTMEQQRALLEKLPDWAKDEPLAWAIRLSHSWGSASDFRVLLSTLNTMRAIAAGDPEAPAAPVGKIDGAHLRELLGRFPDEVDKLAAAIAKRPGGAWLATDALAASQASRAYAALDQIIRFSLDTRGVTEEAAFKAEVLGGGNAKHPFLRYARHLVQAKERTLNLDVLIADMSELTALGPTALFRLYQSIREQGRYGRSLLIAAPIYAESCDSRPGCRAAVSDVAYYDLEDLAIDERLRSSALAEVGPQRPDLYLRHVGMARDAASLLDALRRASTPSSARVRALAAASEWLPATDVESAFRRLRAGAPSDIHVVEEFGKWLLTQKRPGDAAADIDQYIQLDRPEGPLDMLLAKTLRARSLQAQGKLDEAWKELEPLQPSMYGPPLQRAALVLADQGRYEGAIAIAQRGLERYPDATRVATLANVLWRAGKPAEAATLIRQWSPKLTIIDWRFEIGGAFATAFTGRDAETGVSAFEALVRAEPDPQGLREMLVRKDLAPELKFGAYEKIPARGMERYLDLARLHVWLTEWKGRTEADAWLDKALPAAQRDPMSQWAYTAGALDLTFTFVPDPAPQSPHAPFIWLMRTAAYFKSADRPDAWRKRLDAHYATPGNHPHDLMALYLLGKVEAKTMWTAASSAENRPEAAWVLGLRAEAEADLLNAVRWYRATRQAARQNSGEAQWASDALVRWRDSGKSLALLAAEAKSGAR